MADDGSTQSSTVWPLPKFHFQVKWDSDVMSFQEVSGLSDESQVTLIAPQSSEVMLFDLP